VCEVNDCEPYIDRDKGFWTEFIFTSPPTTEREEKERYTQGEVIESHVQQIVVGKTETGEAEKRLAFLNTVEEIQERKREESYTETKEYLFAYEGRKDIHECCHDDMGCPIRKKRRVAFVNFPQDVVFVIVIYL
jgi:hypothetical protein